MEPFVRVAGVAAPMMIDNLDTDQILPKQFLKVITRRGLARALFFDERFDEAGQPRPGFVLNTAPFSEAVTMIGGENFGCGSSREHAVWALLDFGIRCVIAPSFAEIFFNNCANNGLLAIAMPEETVRILAAKAAAGEVLAVDLESQKITAASGASFSFEIEPQRRQKLLAGLDAIGETLLHEDDISRFEQGRRPRSDDQATDATGPLPQ